MLAEVLLIMAGHASSLLEPDGTIAPAFAPLLHPGEQQVLKELATLASQYRKLKQAIPTLGQQSQYMSSLCSALREILTEYEDLVVETEARILKRDAELVANATVVPLSAVKATFAVWDVQFTALCLLVEQLEAGPTRAYEGSSDPLRWPPGPLMDLLLQRARTGVQRVAAITNRLVHGILDASDPLARAADGYKLNPECIPSCVSPQTREAIAYVGRAVAVVGVGVPRQLAVVHARLLGRVLPQDRYAFDAAVERIKGNISEWLWTRVLTIHSGFLPDTYFDSANYFLLRNGEFALALLREIERLKTSRLAAKPTSRTSGGLIRDTDLSLAILRASLGTSAQNDPSLDSLRFTLVDGPLRPLLPSLAPANVKPAGGPVLFDDFLLGARATLSHTLAWPLDLVLGQAELQTYGAVFAYFSALRRAHVKVLECWGSLSGAWRTNKGWSISRKGKGKGKAVLKDEVEERDELARKRLAKCAWGVVREMVWFLDTLWGYIMTDVVDVQYRKLQSQLRPRRSRSSSGRRGSTTTRAGTTRPGSPTSTHFGPSPSTQFGPSASNFNFRSSTHTSLHASAHPDAPPDVLDFSTLRTLHATYLANIVSGSLLGHSGCASLVRAALEASERFVGMIERWGGDVLPGVLEEGSAGVGGKLVDERLKAVKEIDEAFHSHLEAFYEQLSTTSAQAADGSTIAGNTSAYLRDLFRPRMKGAKDGSEDRRTVERLSLRMDFNAKFSEPHGYGYGSGGGAQVGILQQGGLA